jgi:gliding motility-associated lipoprotein GldH
MPKLFAFIVLFLAITSCTEQPLYETYVAIPNASWSQDSIIEFDVMIEDTEAAYAAFNGIRHNPTYPYRNLYVFREVESERGLEYRDTVMFVLSDNKGLRLGDGFGNTKELIAPIGRAPFKFGERGIYTFRFIQGMRPDAIKGIEDVYFRINMVTEEP